MRRASTTSSWRRRIGLERPPNSHLGYLPVHDLAPGDATTSTTLIVAATPRSGSNMLCSLLASSGAAGYPTEYFQPMLLAPFAERWGVPKARPKARLGQTRRLLKGQPRWWVHRWYTSESMAEFIMKLAAHRTTPNGVFAIKLFPAQLKRMREVWGLDLEAFPGEIRFVFLRRDDVVGQAISYFRARNTEEWVVVDKPRDIEPPDYDAAAILENICFFDRENERWRREFERLGVEPLEIEYADLVDEPAAVARRVLDFVGTEAVGHLETSTKRQADQASERMRAQFIADHPEYADRSIVS